MVRHLKVEPAPVTPSCTSCTGGTSCGEMNVVLLYWAKGQEMQSQSDKDLVLLS